MWARALAPLLAAALLSAAPAESFAAETPVPLAGASSRIDAIRQRGALRACKEITESVLCVGFPAVW